MTYKREMPGSPFPIGINEKPIFAVDFIKWGTPSSPTAVLYDMRTKPPTNVSSTMLSGSASVSGNVVTTPQIQNLEENVTYVLLVSVTISGQMLSTFARLEAEL